MTDCARLRAERDYYRRRWIVLGLHYSAYLRGRDKHVAAVMEELAKARVKDG